MSHLALIALGPCPRWWRPLRRARWGRALRALESARVAEAETTFDALLALGPRPGWRHPIQRKRWDASRRAIMAADGAAAPMATFDCQAHGRFEAAAASFAECHSSISVFVEGERVHSICGVRSPRVT